MCPAAKSGGAVTQAKVDLSSGCGDHPGQGRHLGRSRQPGDKMLPEDAKHEGAAATGIAGQGAFLHPPFSNEHVSLLMNDMPLKMHSS